MKYIHLLFFIFLCILVLGISCNKPTYTSPKPKGYFRIDLPKHTYQTLDTSALPFTCDYATISTYTFKDTAGCTWIHLAYPQQHAVLEMTYFPVHGNLRELMVNDERFVKFHYQKADDVEESWIQDPDAHIYGKIFDIQGKEVACPLQFWISDSANHYLRTSLYFNFSPNNDSLRPVIDYIREDVMQMINTFKWKENEKNIENKIDSTLL